MTILLSQKAEKALLKLKKEKKAKIISSFLELMNNPHIGKKLAGRYDGYFSLRIWPFKIIYQIDKNKIHIIDIG